MDYDYVPRERWKNGDDAMEAPTRNERRRQETMRAARKERADERLILKLVGDKEEDEAVIA